MKLKNNINIIAIYASLISLFFAGILVLLEFVTHTNFILETFKVDYLDTFVLATVFTIIVLLKQPILFYKKHWKKAIFFLPIFLFLSLAIIFMRYNAIYLFLEKEDSIIEWLQLVFILSSSLLSFFLYKSWYVKNKILGIIFLIVSIGFFLVAGEEISWGQRIFNFQTPAEYAKVNTQAETTLHNYGPVFGLVYRGYIAIGLIGALAWIFRSIFYSFLPKLWQKISIVLIPNWYYFTYFIITSIYNYQKVFINYEKGNSSWEEPVELLLFFGITLFLFEKWTARND